MEGPHARKSKNRKRKGAQQADSSPVETNNNINNSDTNTGK